MWTECDLQWILSNEINWLVTCCSHWWSFILNLIPSLNSQAVLIYGNEEKTCAPDDFYWSLSFYFYKQEVGTPSWLSGWSGWLVIGTFKKLFYHVSLQCYPFDLTLTTILPINCLCSRFWSTFSQILFYHKTF